MAADQEDDDKQFEPSQKKLDDARKKGEIAKSMDLVTAAAYLGFLVAALAVGPAALLDLGGVLQGLLDQADTLSEVAFEGSQTPLMGGLLWSAALAAAPWFAGPAILATLAVFAQQAFVFAPNKLAPKASRISPISGVKNKFGRQGLFEFAKSFTKLSIYSIVLGVYLFAQRDRMLGAMYLSPGMIAVELGRLIVGLMLIVMLIAAALGGIDFVWQRAEHHRKNRMSRKEMMDELKQSEGDPAMKQVRRQKGYDLATNRMLADVPTADVVVVNPTHFAVALAWDRMPGSAPVCLAKGTDEIAMRIRELAFEHAVPVHSDPPTARSLFATVDIGDQITPEHFAAVAAAIRFAERAREKARR